MSKHVLDLMPKQIEQLKEEMRDGKFTLKELASRYGVEYPSLMYWMQRNRIPYHVKLENGKNISYEPEKKELSVVKVDDELRFKIVKDVIRGDKLSAIASRYDLNTQDVVNELQNHCIQADLNLIRNNIKINKKDSIRFNTIAYILANPNKTRNDFREDTRFSYNSILQSIYFLIDLGVLQKTDYVPIRINNKFLNNMDASEQLTFMEAVQENMSKDELANMFGIEVYEVDKILQSYEFIHKFEDYKQNEKNRLKGSTSAENEESIIKNHSSDTNNVQNLEKELKKKTLELDRIKLQIEIKNLEKERDILQSKISKLNDKIQNINNEISNI